MYVFIWDWNKWNEHSIPNYYMTTIFLECLKSTDCLTAFKNSEVKNLFQMPEIQFCLENVAISNRMN